MRRDEDDHQVPVGPAAQPVREDEPQRVALGSGRSRAEAPTIRAKRPSELPPSGEVSQNGTRLGVGVDPAARAARDAAFDGRATVGATRMGVNVFKPSREDIARARRDSAPPVDAPRARRDSAGPLDALAECPDDDTLIALVEKALPADRVAALADHVDRCERCRATVGALAGTDDAVAVDGKRVGRYELREQLGAGGMGVVWAAWDPMLERRVAIKLLRPEAGEHGPARMLREARAAAQLQHPNVVAVHDVGEHDGGVFIACELVDGEPLDRWQSGKSATAIVDVYVQAARGLAAAHAIGLVHRDVKPSNILVAKDGRARVGDFGLARRQDRAAVSVALTRAGDVVGTPAYMAPEQRHGEAVDARADQFALCVALAESLGGRRPAADTTADELRVEPRYARAIARGLRMDPDDRFADMTALVAALAAPAASGSRRPRWIGGVVAGVAVVAIGTVVALRPSGSEVVASPPIGASPQNPLLASNGVGVGVGNGGNGTGIGIGAGNGNGNGSGNGNGNGAGIGNGSGGGNGNGNGNGNGSGNGNGNGSGNGSGNGNGNGNGGDGSGGRHRDVDQLATGSGAKPSPTTKQPVQKIVPSGGSGAQPQQQLNQHAWNIYVTALDQVNNRDARCLATFAKYDAANANNAPLPAAIQPHDDKLQRARCLMLDGQCAAGAAAITAQLASEGLSKTTIADEVQRESTMSCSTSPHHGTWRERLTRLASQGIRTRFATVAVIAQAMRDTEAVVRDAKGSTMTSTELVELMSASSYLAEGFARYDGHCGDARRAYALAVAPYASTSITDALKACLTSPSTP